MKYIFYLHSNICIVTVKNIVYDFVKENKDVTILLDRNVEWPFEMENIHLFNLQEYPIYASYKRTKTRTLRKYMYERKMYKYFEEIIAAITLGENYFLYIPNYNIPIISIMANNDKCVGYYFIEEGTLSYLTSKQLKENTNYKKSYKILASILSLHYYPMLYVNKKFIGSIAISESAFPWNRKNKMISNIENATKSKKYDKEMHIIILSYLEKDTKDTIECIEYLLSWLKNNQVSDIYIKFHPQSYINQKEKVKEIKCYLHDKLDLIKELSIDYIVEYNLMYGKSSIYNIFHISSLSIYAKRFNCKSFLLEKLGNKYKILEN